MKTKKIIFYLSPFLLVALANFLGFRTSYKRMRDMQRTLDLGKIESGLLSYKSEFGYYPASDKKGRMVACPGEGTGYEKDLNGDFIILGNKKPKLKGLVPCEFGRDSLLDAVDVNYPAYIDKIPTDPQKELVYFYISDEKSFSIYAHYELKAAEEYSKGVRKEKIYCGQAICNAKRSGK